MQGNPPALNYDLRTRKRSIAIIWTLLVVITCIQVEVLYFALRYAADKTVDKALQIPTAILLALSVLSITFRTWQLMRKGSTCRPISGTWYGVSQAGVSQRQCALLILWKARLL